MIKKILLTAVFTVMGVSAAIAGPRDAGAKVRGDFGGGYWNNPGTPSYSTPYYGRTTYMAPQAMTAPAANVVQVPNDQRQYSYAPAPAAAAPSVAMGNSTGRVYSYEPTTPVVQPSYSYTPSRSYNSYNGNQGQTNRWSWITAPRISSHKLSGS